MVREQLEARGIRDAARARRRCARVPRHRFVAAGAARRTPTTTRRCRSASDQTISQPYMVALMTEALGAAGRRRASSRSAPARATRRRCSPSWARASSRSSASRRWRARARGVLARARLRRPRARDRGRDGTLGWPADAPYDGIVVTAAAPRAPSPAARAARARRRLVAPDRRAERADAGARAPRRAGAASRTTSASAAS